jgi:hypothetical protein
VVGPQFHDLHKFFEVQYKNWRRWWTRWRSGRGRWEAAPWGRWPSFPATPGSRRNQARSSRP